MKNPDNVLRDLLAARDNEVHARAAARRTAQTETNRVAERKNERAMAALGNMADVVRRMTDESDQDANDARRQISQARAQLLEAPKVDAAVRSFDRPANVSAAGLYAILAPYYVRLYNSDGTNYYSS